MAEFLGCGKCQEVLKKSKNQIDQPESKSQSQSYDLKSQIQNRGLDCCCLSVNQGLSMSTVTLVTYINLGGSAEMCTSVDKIKLTFSLLIRGIACSYDFR